MRVFEKIKRLERKLEAIPDKEDNKLFDDSQLVGLTEEEIQRLKEIEKDFTFNGKAEIGNLTEEALNELGRILYKEEWLRVESMSMEELEAEIEKEKRRLHG